MLSAAQELAAWQVQSEGTNDFVSMKNLAHRRGPAGVIALLLRIIR